MKLHLPSGLRKALLACLAAFAMPAFTVSSGAALFGGVAFAFLTGQQASADDADCPPLLDILSIDNEEDSDLYAPISLDDLIAPYAFVGPNGGWGTSATAYSALQDAEGGGKLLTGDTWVSLDVNPVFSMASRINNLKLEVTSDRGWSSGDFNVENLWVTGNNRLTIDVQSTGFNTGNIAHIYVNGAHLCFGDNENSFWGERKLNTTFHLGASVYTESTFNNTTLRVDSRLETTGGLVIEENGAKITLRSPVNNPNTPKGNTYLSFDDKLSGTGSLTVDSRFGYTCYLALLSGGSLEGGIELQQGAGLQLGAGSSLSVSSLTISNASSTNGYIKVAGDSGTASLNVSGALTVSGTTGSSYLRAVSVNAASLAVNEGTFYVGGADDGQSATLTTTGAVTVAAGAALTVRNGSSFTAGGAVNIAGTFNGWVNQVTFSQGGAIATYNAENGSAGTLSSGAALNINQMALGSRATTFSGGSLISIGTLTSNSIGPVTVDAGTSVRIKSGNYSGALDLKGALSFSKLTDMGSDYLLGISRLAIGDSGSLSIDITSLDLTLNTQYKLYNWTSWDRSLDSLVHFTGLGEYTWENGYLTITQKGGAGDTVLDNGLDVVLDGDSFNLNNVIVSLSSANSSDVESTINIENGSAATAGNITINEGATLVLDGSGDRSSGWSGGSLSVTGTITNNGTLVIGGYASGDGAWNTVFGDQSKQVPSFTGTGDLVLDFDVKYTGGMARPSIRRIIGTAYTGNLTLSKGVFRWENTTSEAGYGEENKFSVLTIKDGAQFYMQSCSYSGTVHIAGKGYAVSAAEAQDGALRFYDGALSGQVILDDDARVAIYHNVTLERNAGFKEGSVVGNGHHLYKRDGGVLSFWAGVQISGLAGLHTEQSVGDTTENSGAYLKGGTIVLTDRANLIIGTDFEFGVNDGTSITVKSDATISSEQGEGGSAVAGTITKTGAGTLNLLGNMSAYTGTLAVQVGTVKLGRTIAASNMDVSVATGATLQVGEAANDAVTIGGLSGTGKGVITTEQSAVKIVINSAEGRNTTTNATIATEDAHQLNLRKEGAGKQTIASNVKLNSLEMAGGTLALTGGGSTGDVAFSGTSAIQLGTADVTVGNFTAEAEAEIAITAGGITNAGALVMQGESTNAFAAKSLTIKEGGILRIAAPSKTFEITTLNVEGTGKLDLAVSTLKLQGNSTVNIRNGGLVSTYTSDSAYGVLTANGATINFLAATEANSKEWSKIAHLDARTSKINIAGNVEVFAKGITCGEGTPTGTINVEDKGSLKLTNTQAATWGGTLNVAAGGTVTAAANAAKQTLSKANISGNVVVADGKLELGTAHILAGGSLIYDGGALEVTTWDVTGDGTAAGSGALKIVRGKTLSVSSLYKCDQYTLQATNPLDGTASTDWATLEWISASAPVSGSEFGEGIKLKMNFDPNGTVNVTMAATDLAVQGQLELASGEVQLSGTNKIAQVTTNKTGTGRLILQDGSVVTIGGGAAASDINNTLTMNGATLHLIGGLTIKDLKSSGNNTIDSLGSNGQKVAGADLTIDTTGDNTYNGSINISGVLKKKGVGTQTITKNVQADGDISVEGGKLALEGNVRGGSNIIISGTEVIMSGSAAAANDAAGLVSLRGENGKLTLGRDVVVGGLSSLDAESVSGTQKIAGSGTLTLNVAAQTTAKDSLAHITVEDGVTLVKAGEGTQSLANITTAGTVRVAEGTLQLTGAGVTGRIGDLRVEAAGTLEIARKGWSSAGENGTAVTLAGGALHVPVMPEATSDHVKIALSSLTLGEGESSFAWTADGSAPQRINGQLSVTFDKLTSATNSAGQAVQGGKLVVADFGSADDDANHRRRLVFSTVEDFAGELSADQVTGPYSRIAIGHVNQSAGVSGKINVGGGVYSNDFRKEGKGALDINELSVIVFSESGAPTGKLYMDYEGTLTGLTPKTLHVAEGASLYYTEGYTEISDSMKQLEWHVDELLTMHEGIYLNIDDVLTSYNGAVKLVKGICLGITGVDGYSEDQLAMLKQKMTLANADWDTEWSLRVQDDKLWLVVDSFVANETSWDENWVWHGGLYNAPGDDLMESAAIRTEDRERLVAGDAAAKSFADNALALEGHVDYTGGPLQNVITLTDGSTSSTTLATVIGGQLYSTDNEALDVVQGSSYILLKPEEGKADKEVRYHLLVGGSSCASNWTRNGAEDDSNGGFVGTTHIQMEGGTVDYIVGGNHVTNRAFSFNGSSYISVMSGDVRGGIVGGSTLTVGSAADQEDVVEFEGSGSYIFIYTALHNTATTPELSAGEGVADNAFTAVVGGNAWVGLPHAGTTVQNMAPAFRANSLISIDLSPKVEELAEPSAAVEQLVFEKDIVGGNYTVFTSQGSENGFGNRSTVFEGNAAVTISIGDRADEDVIFTGSIVGASRRASGGDGSTVFVGNTEVTLNGGTYQKAVVGGMRFDSTADGAHTALLQGNTNVTVNGGCFWRVVGGSYSLAGKGGTGVDGNPESEGDASVVINGGSFAASYGSTTQEGQKGQGFVAGGDFYRSTGGTDHLRDGNTSVTITGGKFVDLHIAGGDYANFTGVAAGNGTEIGGSSSVEIGGGAVSITGLVIGGSYLTDEGQGGGVRVNKTAVTIGAGTELTAEGDETGHLHRGIAVVAGHVIIDEGEDATQTGGHRATVYDGTELSMTGGLVSGHLVGGSYVNETDGVNELISLGTNTITLTGGELNGHVYGGHYSENTTQPDKLTLEHVQITLAGSAVVNGDIVGGNYRSATVAATGADAPTQGDIVITLAGGELQGNVYAAGRHTGKDAALQVVTESTTVKVSSAVKLGEGSTISGGYDKVSSKDKSRVGSATLVFDTAGAAYANLDAVSRWVEFDTVDAAADVTLAGRFTAANKGSFTKLGSGTLTLERGLLGANGADYAGHVQVDGGILAVGAAHKLSSLGFDMTSRKGSNNMSTAYLQAVGAGALALPTDGLVDVLLTGESLRAGTYYLTGALDGVDVTSKAAEDLFSWDQAALTELAKKSRNAMDATLIIKNGCLVLRAFVNDPDHWFWQGGESNVWSNHSAADWSRSDGSALEKDAQDADLTLADVYFNAGAETYDVIISGTVTPHDVYVESGSFTFTAENAATGGIELVNGGKLYVGTEEEADAAELRLELDNKSISDVVLQKSGTLTLASAGALNGNNHVDFNGGKLVYAEVDGELAFTEDLSRKVVAANEAAATGGGIIRLQVGDSAVLRSAGDLSVTWGKKGDTRANNMGLQRALTDGIEKSGRGNLTLIWSESSSATLEGVVDVQEGALTLALTADAAETLVTLGGEAMSVAGGATLQLTATGSGRMVVNRALAGEGRVEIGAAAGNYTLDAVDNAAFGGTIALIGDSSQTTVVRVNSADALGGADSTLELAGRQVRLVGAGNNVLRAGTVHVAEGSVNYLGDVNYTANNVNAAITLTGNVVGSGVLANAQGGFSHEITGDVSGFTGILVAGAMNVGDGDFISTWTLRGDAPQSIEANLAGTGIINFAYAGEAQILLAGQVGDEALGRDTSLRNEGVGTTLVLASGAEKNTSLGSLILAGGDFQIGRDKDATGNWEGSIEGQGTLTLVSGSIAEITDRGDVDVVANVAKGAEMDVNGTGGDCFSAVTVNEDGRLNRVSGTIIASSLGVYGTSVVTLKMGEKNVGNGPGEPGDYMIGMEPGGKMHVGNAEGLIIDFGNSTFISLLKKFRADETHDNRAYLHVLDGGELSFAEGLEDDLSFLFGNGGTPQMLKDLGFRLDRTPESPGDIELTGTSENVYLVIGPDGSEDAKSDERHVTEWDQFDGYLATVVDSGATLHIEMSEHSEPGVNDRITVENLVGLDGSTLKGTNNIPDGGDITIVLDNTRIGDILDGTGLGSVGKTADDVRGQDTEFYGTIIGEERVNFEKTGKGTLTVGNAENGNGGLLVEGELALKQGSIVVAGDRGGEGNELGALVFDYAAKSADGENRGITLQGGATTVHGIEERGAYKGDDVVSLKDGASLVYDAADEAVLKSARFEGDGELVVNGASLTLDSSKAKNKERLSGVSVSVVSGGSLSLTEETQMIDGALHAADGGSVAVVGSTISGSTAVLLEEGTSLALDSSTLDTTGSIRLDEASEMSLSNDSTLTAAGGLTVDGLLDLGGTTGHEVTGLTGSGTLRGGVPTEGSSAVASDITLHGKANSFSGTLDGAGKLFIGESDGLTLERVSRGKSAGAWDLTNQGDLTIDLRDGAKSALGDLYLGSNSTTKLIINTDEGKDRMGNLDLNNFTWERGAAMTIHNEGTHSFSGSSIDLGILTGSISSTELNITLVGATFAHYEKGALRKDKSTKHWVLDLSLSKVNLFRTNPMEKNAAAGADMLWAASDPNSVNWQRLTAGDVSSSDLYRLVDVVSALDNKTQAGKMGEILAAAAGASTSVLGAAFAQDMERQLQAVRNRTTSMNADDRSRGFNVWLNGEGSYHKLDADSLAPGYTLSSWGGTVGMDMSVNNHTTVGLALSALYGRLKTDSADNGRGDMDTTYATFFARVSQGAWMHTILFSGGMADVKLNRTVNYGDYSYKTKGSTDGYAAGLLYELGYAHIMNPEGSFLLQSVFNVELRHATINGYNETGSDAGLTVGDADYNTLTVGAGARMQAMVGSRALNRSALLEARALVKVDAGDRSGKVENDFINGNRTKRELESAEIGAVGIELGAGVTVPVGKRGSFFMDGSVELRAGYSSLDANVGYKVSF